MVNFILCIDDTDNIGSKGTGSIASEIASLIEVKYCGECSFVTRHQLLLNERINYTSHNSSMAFRFRVSDSVDFDVMIEDIVSYMEVNCASDSSPGLAVLRVLDDWDYNLLLSYGKDAKVKVLNKKVAYDIALRDGVFLNGIFGGGEGVIGALAGVALRLSDNDGEVKGEVKGYEQYRSYLASSFRSNPEIDEVRSVGGRLVSDDDFIFVSWKVKLIFLNGKRILLVDWVNNRWESVVKNDLRSIDNLKANLMVCSEYEDDVNEEFFIGEESCLNCRYRRWLNYSFSCLKDNA